MYYEVPVLAAGNQVRASESYLQPSKGTLQDWGDVSMDKVSTVNHEGLGLESGSQVKARCSGVCP